MKKTLSVISILLIITMMLVTFIFAQDPTDPTKVDESNPVWYQDKGIDKMVEGINQYPELLADPFFFSLFEQSLAKKPESLNHDFDTLQLFGKQIGVTFTDGSGISAYNPSTRIIITKGCINQQYCNDNGIVDASEVRFSPYEITGAIVNPDGSIYVPEAGFWVDGTISKDGEYFSVKDGSIYDDESEMGVIGQQIKTKGDGIYSIKEGTFTWNVPFEVDYNGEEVDPAINRGYDAAGDDFTVDAKEKHLIITAKKPVSISESTDDVIVPVIILSKGRLTIEDYKKPKKSENFFVFDKDSSFQVDRGVYKVFNFNVAGKTRLCYGDCYKDVTPATYKKEGVSTIEFVRKDAAEGAKDKSDDIIRESLKLNAVNGGIDVEMSDMDLIRPPLSGPYGHIYVNSYTKGSKDVFGQIDTAKNVVTIKQIGERPVWDEETNKRKGTPSFYSSLTISGDQYTLAYGTKSKESQGPKLEEFEPEDIEIEESVEVLPFNTLPVVINNYNPNSNSPVQKATLIEHANNQLWTRPVKYYLSNSNINFEGDSRPVTLGDIEIVK